MYQIHTIFVDCYEKDFWVIWLCSLFNFEEGGAKCGPLVNDLEELYLRIIARYSRVTIIIIYNSLKKKYADTGFLVSQLDIYIINLSHGT